MSVCPQFPRPVKSVTTYQCRVVSVCPQFPRPVESNTGVCLFVLSFRGQFTIVPILVGSLTPDKEALYGRLLAPYLADPANLFVVSSDFCHWGQRFRYVNGADRANGHIHEFIQQLDREVSRIGVWRGVRGPWIGRWSETGDRG